MDARWKRDISLALKDFSTLSDLAGSKCVFEDEDVEFLPAPHRKPRHLPTGKMAVYGFWFDGAWLKIGKAGPNSNVRYTSQPYGFSAGSTLAKSLRGDASMRNIAGLEEDSGAEWGEWIERETSRVNILLPSTRDKN
jgi:hypothetical protein